MADMNDLQNNLGMECFRKLEIDKEESRSIVKTQLDHARKMQREMRFAKKESKHRGGE